MSRFIYTVLLRLISPILLGWMYLRARRSGGQWQVFSPLRFGYYGKTPSPTQPVIVVHAVSLGEMRAAQPLVQALLDAGHQVLLTHLTYTGYAEGQRAFNKALAEGHLQQQWLPYDFPGAARRFYAHYQPKLFIVIEREVWPNLMHQAYRADIPSFLVSARFSARSLRKALRIGLLMRQTLGYFTAIYAQTYQDAVRLELAGGKGVRVSGNFKFDVQLSQDQVERGKQFANSLGRKIVVIASTREGEDQLFIDAMRRYIRREHSMDLDSQQRTLFYLIPRHPQRFESAAILLEAEGWNVIRRTELMTTGDCTSSSLACCKSADVVLGDSLGEMPWYYAQAQVAIIGGSFAQLGGQNFIEACALGVPVIVGPHTRNFEQAVNDALSEGAAVRVTNAEAALKQAMHLLEDSNQRQTMSDAASFWVRKHTGSVDRVMTGVKEVLKKQYVRNDHR
ncbi:3-deoxy-D-manno-octulosonic acid transferase [Paenalcaligenes hominis]|uniref:3-deoxy-D-manno-octulosonic acid transferase n=1 Tax=Paenalcaligenes hominis TaxID=643674 RepID=UPI00352632E6